MLALHTRENRFLMSTQNTSANARTTAGESRYPQPVDGFSKRVIVHADDFGLTAGVNRGIVKAFKNGILTSTSIMPSGEAFDDAVKLAEENPDLDLGIHLTLVGEMPVAPPQEIPSLVIGNGRFRNKYPIFLRDYLLRRVRLADIERELTAQFDRVTNTRLPISHVDGHQHLHILPGILEIVAKLAKRYHIQAIRIPMEGLRFKHFLAWSGWARLMLQLGTNIVCRLSVKRINLSDLQTVEAFYGFFYSGRMTRENLIDTIEVIDGGVAEIMCHPGLEDPSLRARYTDWNYQWGKELEALTDPSVRDLIKQKRIRLIGYRDLSPQKVVQ